MINIYRNPLTKENYLSFVTESGDIWTSKKFSTHLA